MNKHKILKAINDLSNNAMFAMRNKYVTIK